MIDIKFLRENPDVVKENIRKKFQDEKLPLVDEVIALDAESRKAKQEADDGVSITSPIVGLFYAAPAENAEPYVSLGDRVKKGQTLCIVEAMKLMNEIVAETDGQIVEICAQNGQVVDFGCPLFRIK